MKLLYYSRVIMNCANDSFCSVVSPPSLFLSRPALGLALRDAASGRRRQSGQADSS